LQRVFVLIRRRSSLPSRADPARPCRGGRSRAAWRGMADATPLHAVRRLVR
jgi:hypothetical protein